MAQPKASDPGSAGSKAVAQPTGPRLSSQRCRRRAAGSSSSASSRGQPARGGGAIGRAAEACGPDAVSDPRGRGALKSVGASSSHVVLVVAFRVKGVGPVEGALRVKGHGSVARAGLRERAGPGGRTARSRSKQRLAPSTPWPASPGARRAARRWRQGKAGTHVHGQLKGALPVELVGHCCFGVFGGVCVSRRGDCERRSSSGESAESHSHARVCRRQRRAPERACRHSAPRLRPVRRPPVRPERRARRTQACRSRRS